MDTPPRFPKPDPARAYAEYKIFNAQGDPLRRPHEDWDGAKKRLQTDPTAQTWLAVQRADVDDWMTHRRDHVEWVAGWWHDFVSPKDGSFLTWTPDAPGSETLRSPSDPKVVLTPLIWGGWVYKFRNAHGIKIADAARLFRITGEARYGEWAASQLDFYAENFTKWPLQKRGSGIWESVARLFHQPLDEAVNLTNHIEATRLIWDTVSPERKQNWLVKLFRPQADLLEQSFQSIHNIACWQRSAVGHVALLYHDADLWHKAVDAPFGIRQQLVQGVTSDHFWYEQSLLYNDYVVQALLGFFVMASRMGRENELRHEMLVAENLLLAPLALRFPNGDLPTPADGQRRKTPNRALMGTACRLFPTPIGLAQNAQTISWSSLVDAAAAPSPKSSAPDENPALPPPHSRSLESSRMALLVKNNWQVYFHYGQLLQSHAQAEALHYEVWHGGVSDLSHDAGTVGYGSPLHKHFFTQGIAHNVPLVGGLGQSGWSPGELTEWSPEKGRVSARQKNYRPGVQAGRTLHINGDQLIDTADIALTDSALPDAPLGLTLHLQGSVVVPGDWIPAPNLVQDRPEGFGFWKQARQQPTPTKTVSLLVHYDDHTFRVTLQASEPCRVFHAITPDAPPNERNSLYLETAAPCRKATFVTTWEVARP